MMNRIGTGSMLLLLLCAACASSGRVAETVPRGSLSGAWQLNDTESSAVTNLSVPFRDVRDSLPGVPAPPAPPSLARAVTAVERGIEHFTITDEPNRITFRFADAHVAAVVPDWTLTRAVWADGDTVELRARRENGRLRVERRLDAGITATDYYSRGPGASYLVVYTVARGGSGSEATVRRVYDAANVRSDE